MASVALNSGREKLGRRGGGARNVYPVVRAVVVGLEEGERRLAMEFPEEVGSSAGSSVGGQVLVKASVG